jgi:hypothetical protein
VRTVAARPSCSTLARTWAGAVALLRRRGSPAGPLPSGGGWCSPRFVGALPGSGGYTMRAPRFRSGLVAFGRAAAWAAMVGRRRRDGVLMAALGLASGAGRQRRRRSQSALVVARVGRRACRGPSIWVAGVASLVAAADPRWPCRPLRAMAGRSLSASVAGWRRHGGGARGGWCFS